MTGLKTLNACAILFIAFVGSGCTSSGEDELQEWMK